MSTLVCSRVCPLLKFVLGGHAAIQVIWFCRCYSYDGQHTLYMRAKSTSASSRSSSFNVHYTIQKCVHQTNRVPPMSSISSIFILIILHLTQIILLERALRRAHPGAAKDASAGAGAVVDGSSTAAGMPAEQAPQHPMCEHLEWCLPAIAALLRVLQALSAADAAGALGPLQVCWHGCWCI